MAGGDNLSRRIDQSGEQIKMDDWPSSPLTGMPPTQTSLARKVCVLLNAFKNKKLIPTTTNYLCSLKLLQPACLELASLAGQKSNKQGRVKVVANEGEPWLHPLTCVRATYKGTIKDEMFPAATATPAPKTYLVGYSDGGRKVPSPVWFVV